MKNKRLLSFVAGATLATFCAAPVVQAQTDRNRTEQTTESTGEGMLRPWSWGTGIGFLSETPDDTAFAWNVHGDYFYNGNFSIGPLAQLAFTGDLAQYGFSAQAKYWWGIPDPGSATRLFVQAGAGFVHCAFQNDDTSFLIPIGFGIDHTLLNGPSVYGSFLLNFTDLDTGRGTDADLMPGVSFGVRF